jgi:DMSO/TMAO reductase YedYZ molybdopterin-dependent catalytic subunit
MEPSGPFLRHPLQPHQLRDRVTRTEDTIVLWHLGLPHLDAGSWSLAIDGLVDRPMDLTLGELRRRPRVELASIHQCCGNPLQPDVPTRRICNVVWGGVWLADLIAECRPRTEARFLWASGADHGTLQGVTCDAYVKDVPLERVANDVLVAYEMNGAPLRLENGYPARLVVPGYYGTNSVKWLRRLTLADVRASGPFTTRWYSDIVRDETGQPTGKTRPVWSIAPESVIVSPAPNQVLKSGEPVEVWGWAWADGGVDAVDVGIDSASDWMQAAVERPTGREWQRFSATWRPERRGAHELCSRARSGDGRSQPSSGARNAIHRVLIEVA